MKKLNRKLAYALHQGNDHACDLTRDGAHIIAVANLPQWAVERIAVLQMLERDNEIPGIGSRQGEMYYVYTNEEAVELPEVTK